MDIDLGLIVALAKAMAIKYSKLGIKNIQENANKNGISIVMNDNTTYDLEFGGMMLKGVYDTQNLGIVDNSQKLNGKEASFYLTSTNINYDNSKTGLKALNIEDAISETLERIEENIGKTYQLDFNCTLENNVITGYLDNSISNFSLIPHNEYIFNLVLPISTLTGDLSNEYQIVLVDKNKNIINIHSILNTNINSIITVREMCQLQDYTSENGFKWTFKGRYNEVTENSSLYRLIYTTDIIRETNPSMSGIELYKMIAHSLLKPGTTVMCTEDWISIGFSFLHGHTYKIRGTWTDAGLSIDAFDISLETGIANTKEDEGWTITTYATGEKKAIVEIDYPLDEEIPFDAECNAWEISEPIPTGLFIELPLIDVLCADYTPGAGIKNSIIVGRQTLPSRNNTGKYKFQAMELHCGVPGYTKPTKLHVIWVARGR